MPAPIGARRALNASVGWMARLDLPKISLSSPTATTSDDTPLVAGTVTWNNRNVSGLTIAIKLDGAQVGTATTDENGNFAYEITTPLAANTAHSIDVSVLLVDASPASISLTVEPFRADTLQWRDATIAAGYTPDAVLLEQVNAFIKEVEACGALAVMDRLVPLWMPDVLAARCVKTFSRGSSTAIFTPDRGYMGDGVDDIINFFDTSVTTKNLAQNSAHIGVFSLTAGANSNYHVGNPGGSLKVRARGGTNSTVSVNTTTGLAALGTAPMPQHVVGNRVLASEQEIHVNGALNNKGSQASSAVVSSLVRGLTASSAYSNAQVGLLHIGGGMTQTMIAGLYAAALKFGRARGALT